MKSCTHVVGVGSHYIARGKTMNDIGKRILVIGSPGSGKSTFSRKLAEITGIPLIHLDKEF